MGVIAGAGLAVMSFLWLCHMSLRLLPACALLGASLVTLSDLAGRVLFSPAELPAGILMAAMGAPFFLFLLFKRSRTYD